MKLKIKSLIEFQIYYLMIVMALIDLLKLPDTLRYVLDVNNLLLIFLYLLRRKKHEKGKWVVRYLLLYMGALIFISVLLMKKLRYNKAG